MDLAIFLWTLLFTPANEPPVRSHEIQCARASGDGTDGSPQTITLRYDIEVIEVVDNDIHGTVVGEFEMSACYYAQEGTLEGGITPRIWYGGGFDVSLDGTRFLILREWDATRAFVWFGVEAVEYECAGTLPD